MVHYSWDWVNQSNKKEAIYNELRPLVQSIASNENVTSIVTSPEICVILEETDVFYPTMGDYDYTLHSDDETELCGAIIDNYIQTTRCLFKDSDDNIITELKIVFL